MDPQLLEILCCPATKQALRLAHASELETLNARIAAGEAQNHAGETIREALQEALVSADGKILYPIRQSIPVMLVDESILIG